MNSIHLALPILLTTITCLAQGQVNFANRVGAGGSILNAPVIILGTQDGPGLAWSAQLVLVGANNSLNPLTPISTFNPAGTGDAVIASRYWAPQTVTIDGHFAGENLIFRVRAWQTAYGTFEAAMFGGAAGQSADFAAVLGGASQDPDIPPATPGNLLNLKSFAVGNVPEPSTLTIGLLGSAVLGVCRRVR